MDLSHSFLVPQEKSQLFGETVAQCLSLKSTSIWNLAMLILS